MRYGLPHKGSKNAIAKWIVDLLPRSETFVDLFFGGGAVTHRAMLIGKYNRFIANDIDGRLPKLFADCAHGKYAVDNHPEWISRTEFNERKADDAYIALVWSFGNNGKDYLYGKGLEDYKQAYHHVIFENKPELLLPFGVKLTKSEKSEVYERYLDYQRQIACCKPCAGVTKRREGLESLERVQTLEHLQSLQHLQSLESLEGLEGLEVDYQEVKAPNGAIIYCDPPYASTNCGKYAGFDNDRFCEWAERQSNIFISEYKMPDSFVLIGETQKTVLSTNSGTSPVKSTERLYTNERTWSALSNDLKQYYRMNLATQMTFF